MKKFLSLALALVMSLSLLTVASAAEYKDLTDKSEITYSEAVAVLNKLGIISGYEDGSFKPDTALNRAQAAKIICGLLLGQKTADKLTVTSAPFKDVAADYWAAAYISYCKNAGILDGYSDGTFHPTETLTGYQFGKMLLTALGYDSATEGFIGRGWTLNVAKVGNTISLFKGNDEFSGNSEVTREEACLYALNMLKATEVTYDGLSIDVSTGDSQVSINNSKAEPVTRPGETNAQAWNGTRDGYMQFVEDHFGALKMTDSADNDDFGRPAITWSYKNVTFGTFAKQAKFTFTDSFQPSDDTDAAAAAKVKDMGLKGYSLADKNGETAGLAFNAYTNGTATATALADVNGIPALTGNGTIVEIYVSDDTADEITDVVVIQPQLMQVNKINSAAKSVSLKKVENMGVAVAAVKEDGDCYADLTAMKADDYVVVVPCKAVGDTSYSVASVYAPTTDTGILSKVSIKSGNVNGVTVNGTAYKLAALKYGFAGLDSSSTNGKQDSTVVLDKYGYAMLIKDVTAATDYIIFSTKYTTLVDGKLVVMANGFDLEGNAISLNLGTDLDVADNLAVGSVYTYTTEDTENDAEYKTGIVPAGETDTRAGYVPTSVIKAGAAKIGDNYFASSVKFIYLTFNTKTIGAGDDAETVNTSIKSVTVKDGVQKIEDADTAWALANKDGYVTNVVMGIEPDDATGSDVAYVSAKTGATKVGTKAADIYTLYIDGAAVEGVVSTNTGKAGTFVTYAENEDGTYTLKDYEETTKTTSVAKGNVTATKDGRYITIGALADLSAKDAIIVDIADEGIGSISDIEDLINPAEVDGVTPAAKNVEVAVIYNGNEDSSSYKTVSYIFVTDVAAAD